MFPFLEPPQSYCLSE